MRNIYFPFFPRRQRRLEMKMKKKKRNTTCSDKKINVLLFAGPIHSIVRTECELHIPKIFCISLSVSLHRWTTTKRIEERKKYDFEAFLHYGRVSSFDRLTMHVRPYDFDLRRWNWHAYYKAIKPHKPTEERKTKNLRKTRFQIIRFVEAAIFRSYSSLPMLFVFLYTCIRHVMWWWKKSIEMKRNEWRVEKQTQYGWFGEDEEWKRETEKIAC